MTEIVAPVGTTRALEKAVKEAYLPSRRRKLRRSMTDCVKCGPRGRHRDKRAGLCDLCAFPGKQRGSLRKTLKSS